MGEPEAQGKFLDRMVNEPCLLIAAQEEGIQSSDEELQDAVHAIGFHEKRVLTKCLP
jgi:hypothetical protein